MADSENVVKSWGSLALTDRTANRLAIEIDNSVGSVADADFSGRRAHYLETLHDLSHAAATIYTVFPGVTTEGTYDIQLALRAGSPIPVLYMSLADNVNGGTNEYYWSDQIVSNVDTLWLEPVLTGLVDDWRYTLNTLTLEIAGTENQDHKDVPEKKVGFFDWTNSPPQSEGKPYPEVWGQPGTDMLSDTEKIGSGVGAVPAVLVDRSALKYVVAGHDMEQMSGVGAASSAVAVFVKIPGYDQGLGYLENCTSVLAGTDTAGHAIATIVLPRETLARVFVPSLVEGTYFANTATDPTNAAGRDSTTNATLAAGEILQLAVGQSVEAGDAILRVWIATSKTSADLRVRWTGPQSTTVATGDSNGPRVDSVAGWDDSGKVEISGTVYDYTSITEISATVWRLDVSAYGGPTGAGLDATMVGAWQTVTDQDMEVSDQRDWSKGDFYKLEIEMENTHGSNSHDISYLGFRVEVELSGFPEVFVPAQGISITPVARPALSGALRNPAAIIEDVHRRLMGMADASIGSTFNAAFSALNHLKFDFSLDSIGDTRQLLRELTRQSSSFLWRDASNDVQIGYYRLGDLSDTALTSLDDLVEVEGDELEVSYTPVEDIYNRVRVRWGWNYGLREYTQEYYITEESSEPQDTAREQAAADSQSDFGITREMIVEAKFIQDSSTALELLTFLFDFHNDRRRRLTFKVPVHVDIRPGNIFLMTHPLVTAAENFFVEEVRRTQDLLTVEAVSLSLEASYADEVAFDFVASAARETRWGAPAYWGGSGKGWTVTQEGTIAQATGQVWIQGRVKWAERIWQNTSDLPTHGGVGSGTYESWEQPLALKTEVDRVEVNAASRAGAAVTWTFVHINVSGAGETIRETGLFTDAAGNTLLGRIEWPSDTTLADDESVAVTLTVTVKRPTGGSNLTDYGAELIAQRIYQDIAEVPTHYAIGDDATAADPSDTTLANQIGARQAWIAGYPKQGVSAAVFRALFDSGTYGSNTVREVGIFTNAAGATAILRRVLATEIVLGASDDFAVGHNLQTVEFT